MNINVSYYLYFYLQFLSTRSSKLIGRSIAHSSNQFFFSLYPILSFLFSMNYRFTYFSFYNYGFSYLPKKYKTFTVLRSPHIDKRSREQFHLIEYKCIVQIPIFLGVYDFYPFLFSNSKKGLKIYGNRVINKVI